MTIYGKLSLVSYGICFFLIVVGLQVVSGNVANEDMVCWIAMGFFLAGAILALLQNCKCSGYGISSEMETLSDEEYDRLMNMIQERKKQLLEEQKCAEK